ncbi:hypothetical protein N8972_02215 [Sulfurospirillum sp.]|nr:hypothetical protein [Sulfurospirillum sp.]
MKIDGSNANSINFIEQKYSNTSTLEKNLTQDRTDTFVGKIMSSTVLLESNESVAMLQIAHESITKLQTNSEKLQNLNEKFSFFQSQKSELNEKFEKITVEMLDIVDNTMFRDRGIFYTQHTLNVGESEFILSMKNENSIEDFALGSQAEIEGYFNGLVNIKESISKIKNYIEVANFNQMAALHVNSPLTHIEPDTLTKETQLPTIGVDELKQAHDINLLKDKMSFLLD